MERDRFVFEIHIFQWSISTHTLTWSVTVKWQYDFNGKGISTHTLTWSVTAYITKSGMAKEISTHTLTWSVTRT